MPRTTLTPVQRVFLTPIRSGVCRVCWMFLSVFRVRGFFFISCHVTFFADVLESVALLSCVFASLYSPQSRKYRVSQPLQIPTNT